MLQWIFFAIQNVEDSGRTGFSAAQICADLGVPFVRLRPVPFPVIIRSRSHIVGTREGRPRRIARFLDTVKDNTFFDQRRRFLSLALEMTGRAFTLRPATSCCVLCEALEGPGSRP